MTIDVAWFFSLIVQTEIMSNPAIRIKFLDLHILSVNINWVCKY